MCTSPLLRIERADKKVYIEGAESSDRYMKARIKYSQGEKDALRPWAMYKRVNTIPCGHCMECRLKKSKEWANRIMLESKKWKSNYFVTLTYNEEHLPYRDWFYDENGEVVAGATLDKKELQNFMKKLRMINDRKFRPQVEKEVLWENWQTYTQDTLEENEKGKFEKLVNEKMKEYAIRFYACGEYGGKNGRPHYHIILFNAQCLEDKILFKKTSEGAYYISETLQRAWQDKGEEKGFTLIAEVNYETSRYVAQYVLKKQYGEESPKWYNAMRRIPEFTLMSRGGENGGIGKNYYQENKEQIYKLDGINITTKNGAIKIKPPKYYDNLYDLENHEDLERIKRLRNKKTMLAEEHAQKQNDSTPSDRRKARERRAENKNKLLQRSNIV